MSLLGNLVWLIFGGFFAGIAYVLVGLLISLTIIGIPLGKQIIQLGIASMTPFGREIVVNDDFDKPITMVFNIVWAIFFGWEIAVVHFVHGLVLAITIIGLPFAKQHFKLIPLALAPFGRELQ